MEKKLIARAELEKAMKAVGYQAVSFVPKTIKELKPGARNASEVVDVAVVDVVIEPMRSAGVILLDAKTANFSALSVAKDMGLQFRELQTFDNAVILRWVRNLGE